MASSPSTSVPSVSAPIIQLNNSASLTSVELPGPCSEGSLHKVLNLLGGPSHVASVLSTYHERPNDVSATPELRLRPEDSFAHPVTGGIVESNNIVLKVTTRRRKRRRLENGDTSSQGIFAVEHIGTINRTIRFRDILDYQYAAPVDDAVVSLSEGMRNLDFKSVADYAFPDAHEERPDDLQLIPPPIFSRISLPQWYGYKKNMQTKVETTTNVRGEEVERSRNTSRYSIVAPTAIAYADGVVPTKPPAGIKEGVGTEQSLIRRLTEITTGMFSSALELLVSADRTTNTHSNKQALPFLTYTFSDGPFRELVVRLGFDPRRDSRARDCQRIQLRVAGEKSRSKSSAVKSGPRMSTNTTDDIDRKSHLFDGVELHTDIGTFQFCDLTDPLLQSLPVDGWYVADFADHLRHILKQKFTGLINNEPVSDSDLAADIERMRALPLEGERASEAEESDAGSRSDAGSETASKVKKKKEGAATGAKKKKTKTRPKAKEPVSERPLPEALKSSDTRGEQEG